MKLSENQSKNRNRRRFTQKKKGNSNKNTVNGNKNNDKNNNPPKTREFKFYLHDSVGRKQSESFGKIKEAIIIKIQKTFDDPIDLVTRLETKTKKKYIQNPRQEKLQQWEHLNRRHERTDWPRRSGRSYTTDIRIKWRNSTTCG